MALASLILGLTAIIPLVGVLLGILAILLGVLGIMETGPGKKQGRGMAVAGTILGGVGIIVTIVLYGALFYFGFAAKDGPFAQQKIEVTRQMVTQVAGALELHKKKHGAYPETLASLQQDGSRVAAVDFYFKPLVYKVSADRQNYDLYSLGPDGQDGTADDIRMPQ